MSNVAYWGSYVLFVLLVVVLLAIVVPPQMVRDCWRWTSDGIRSFIWHWRSKDRFIHWIAAFWVYYCLLAWTVGATVAYIWDCGFRWWSIPTVMTSGLIMSTIYWPIVWPRTKH